MVVHHRGLIGTIALSVTLVHAAGLVLLNQPQADSRRGVAPRPRPPAIQMRVALAKPAALLTQAAQEPPLQALGVAPPAQGAVPPPIDEVAIEVPTPLPQDQLLAEQALSPIVADNFLPELDLDAVSNHRPVGSEYVPRPQLSSAPRPSSPVIVPFPKEITTPGRYTAILALFIDETGVVRRVRVDGPPLPSPFENAARDTFLQVHFSPGEVNGQQVKSLIRIEVVFDNSAIASPTAEQQAP